MSLSTGRTWTRKRSPRLQPPLEGAFGLFASPGSRKPGAQLRAALPPRPPGTNCGPCVELADRVPTSKEGHAAPASREGYSLGVTPIRYATWPTVNPRRRRSSRSIVTNAGTICGGYRSDPTEKGGRDDPRCPSIPSRINTPIRKLHPAPTSGDRADPRGTVSTRARPHAAARSA